MIPVSSSGTWGWDIIQPCSVLFPAVSRMFSIFLCLEAAKPKLTLIISSGRSKAHLRRAATINYSPARLIMATLLTLFPAFCQQLLFWSIKNLFLSVYIYNQLGDTLIADINAVNYLWFHIKEETDSDLQLHFPPPFFLNWGIWMIVYSACFSFYTVLEIVWVTQKCTEFSYWICLINTK